jgi:hypothetical protein
LQERERDSKIKREGGKREVEEERGRKNVGETEIPEQER